MAPETIEFAKTAKAYPEDKLTAIRTNNIEIAYLLKKHYFPTYYKWYRWTYCHCICNLNKVISISMKVHCY